MRDVENGNIFHECCIFWRDTHVIQNMNVMWVNIQEVVMDKQRYAAEEEVEKNDSHSHTHLFEMEWLFWVAYILTKNIFMKLEQAHVGHTSADTHARTHTRAKIPTDYVCLRHNIH